MRDIAGFFRLFMRPPEDCLYARHQFHEAERLGHIIVHADPEAAQFIGLGRLGGQHDDRHIAQFAQARTYLPTIHAGHHHIQQD